MAVAIQRVLMIHDVHPVAVVLKSWFEEMSIPRGVPACGNWANLHSFFESSDGVIAISEELRHGRICEVLDKYQVFVPDSILDMIESVVSVEWKEKLVLMNAVRCIVVMERGEKRAPIGEALTLLSSVHNSLAHEIRMLLISSVIECVESLETDADRVSEAVTAFIEEAAKNNISLAKQWLLNMLRTGISGKEVLSPVAGLYLMALTEISNKENLEVLVPDVMELICDQLSKLDNACLTFFSRVGVLLTPELFRKYLVIVLLHPPVVHFDDPSDFVSCVNSVKSANLERIIHLMDTNDKCVMDSIWPDVVRQMDGSLEQIFEVTYIVTQSKSNCRPFVDSLLTLPAFDPNSNDEETKTIRRMVLLWLVSSGNFECLVEIHNKEVIAEVFEILQNDWSVIGADLIYSRDFMSFISKVLELSKSSDLVQQKLLKFVDKAVEQVHEFALRFEDDAEFNQTFFLTTMENPNHIEIVLHILGNVWSYPDIPIKSSPSSLASIVETDSFLKVAAIVGEVLLFRVEEIVNFTPFFGKVMNMLGTVDNYEMLHALLRTLVFLPESSFGAGLHSKIQVAIQRVEGDEPSEMTFSLLFKLLTEIRNVNTISRPVIAQTMIGIHLKSNRLGLVFDKLLGLCKSTFENGVRLHKGKLDIFLLDSRTKIPETYRKQAMDLLVWIASVASSAAAAHRFISLLCPVEGHFLPDDIEMFVKGLLQIFARRKVQPRSYLRLDTSSFIDISGIPSSLFVKDFVIELVLFSNEAAFQYPAKVVQLEDNRNLLLCIEIIDDSLYINSSNVFFTVPAKHWVHLKFSIREDHHQIEISSPFGSTCADVDIPIPHGGSIHCRLGCVSSEEGYESILLSSFEILKGTTSVVSVTDHVMLNLLNEDVLQKKVLVTGNGVCPVVALPDVIEQLFKLDSLIPLIAQMGMKCKVSGRQLGDVYRADVITLLTNALLDNSEAEQTFLQSKCFKIISFLLCSQARETLTYIVYIHFHALANQMTTEASKRRVYKDIVLNMSIWARAELSQVLKVISHWRTVILSEESDIFTDIKPVHRLVDDFLLLFSKQVKALSLGSCFREIISCCSSKQFTQEDLQALVNVSLSLSDPDFVCEILAIIRQIAEEKPSPFVNLASENAQRCLASLSSLVEHENGKVHVCVVETFLALHKCGLFAVIPMSHHLEIMCSQIPLGIELVESLISLLDAYPRLLSIVFRLINQGGPDFLSLVELIRASPAYVTNKAWCLWPFVVAVNFPRVRDYVLDLVIRSNSGDWTTLFNFLEVVASSLAAEISPLQRKLLELIGSFLLEGELPMDIAVEYVELVEYFLVVKPRGYMSPGLKAAFEASPFLFDVSIECDSSSMTPRYDSALQEKLQHVEPVNMTMEERAFYSRMEELQKKHKHVKFGLEVTKDARWADLSLAKISQQVIVRYRLNSDLIQAVKDKIDCQKLKDLFEKKHAFISRMLIQPSRIAMFVLKNRHKTNYFVTVLERIGNRKLKTEMTSAVEKRITRQLDKGRRLWSHLWRGLTIERGPWEDSLPKDEIHFKRDNTLCSQLYPAKLKRNRHFQDHKDAAISRDIGSIQTAQETQRKYDEMKRQEQLRRAPPEILRVTENSELVSELQNTRKVGRRKIFRSKARLIQLKDQTHDDDQCLFTCYHNEIVITNKKQKRIRIHAGDVQYLLMRPYLHRESSISVITRFGQEYFIYIPSCQVSPVLRQISSLPYWRDVIAQTDSYSKFFHDLRIQQQWIEGKMSNFEYLMKLNMFSGRSFMEPSLYPFFPWILQDYSTEVLDLLDPKVFRDLSKPMGTLFKPRLDELRSHLKEYLSFSGQDFLYNSCYVSPLCVFLWMMRQEPFTSLHIQLQSGKFDHAARLFTSFITAYKMASSHMNDYRELIPEFFFCPSLFENRNHFDLGKADGVPVNDVELPPWAKTAMEFVYIHRKALECDHVSESLHQWIDLMWGYKQTGQAAVDADNTFDPMLYGSIWNEENTKDEQQKRVIETMLTHCGHIPPQLFTTPHPARLKKTNENKMSMPFTLHQDVSFGRIDRLRSENYQMTYCDNSGEISRLIAHPLTGEMRVGENGFKPKMDQSNHGQVVILDKHMKLFTINGNRVSKTDLKSGDTVSYSGHHGKVNCMAVSEMFVVSGGTDTILNIWKKENHKTTRHSITTFRDEVVCCDVSDNFHLLAACTRDGSLFLISTTTGVTSKIIDITPEVPVKVAITAGWGFVVVHSTAVEAGDVIFFLHVFNVDGDLIRRQRINFSIRAWTHWTSFSGFDYMVMMDDENNLYAMEAFYLDVESFGSKVPANVIEMKYFTEDEMLVVVGDTCTSFYPSEYLNLNRFNRTRFGEDVT